MVATAFVVDAIALGSCSVFAFVASVWMTVRDVESRRSQSPARTSTVRSTGGPATGGSGGDGSGGRNFAWYQSRTCLVASIFLMIWSVDPSGAFGFYPFPLWFMCGDAVALCEFTSLSAWLYYHTFLVYKLLRRPYPTVILRCFQVFPVLYWVVQTVTRIISIREIDSYIWRNLGPLFIAIFVASYGVVGGATYVALRSELLTHIARATATPSATADSANDAKPPQSMVIDVSHVRDALTRVGMVFIPATAIGIAIVIAAASSAVMGFASQTVSPVPPLSLSPSEAVTQWVPLALVIMLFANFAWNHYRSAAATKPSPAASALSARKGGPSSPSHKVSANTAEAGTVASGRSAAGTLTVDAVAMRLPTRTPDPRQPSLTPIAPQSPGAVTLTVSSASALAAVPGAVVVEVPKAT